MCEQCEYSASRCDTLSKILQVDNKYFGYYDLLAEKESKDFWEIVNSCIKRYKKKY